jgi:hypothetical protein
LFAGTFCQRPPSDAVRFAARWAGHIVEAMPLIAMTMNGTIRMSSGSWSE